MGSPIPSGFACTRSGAAPYLSSFIFDSCHQKGPVNTPSLTTPYPTLSCLHIATLQFGVLVLVLARIFASLDAISQTGNHVNQTLQVQQAGQNHGSQLRYL